MKKILMGFVAVTTMLMMGCGTTSNLVKTAETRRPTSNSGVTIAGKETIVVDWSGRVDGAEAIPSWLSDAKRKDFRAFKTAYGKPDGDVYYCAVGNGLDVRAAEARSEMAVYRQVAQSFQISINSYCAQSENISDKTRDAIGTRTKTESNVNITGLAKAAEDWKQTVEIDSISGEKTQSYIYFIIYEIPAKIYAQTAAKYLKDVVGSLSEDLTPEQEDVKGMLNQMMNDARFPTVMSQEQARQSAEINKKIADAQVGLMPEQQKAAADQALAQIMQDGKTNRTKIVADSKVAQTQAVADASKMAYASGNPVYASAATITGADKEWADAEALAASILFN